MRRRITSLVMKERFETAWGVMPVPERRLLHPFIRYIDEVPVLKGTVLYGRPDKGKAVEAVGEPLDGGTGYTALLHLNSKDIVDIILPSDPLLSHDEGMVLAVILHELAHALDYLIHPVEACKRGWHLSERWAWQRAMQWSSDSTLPDNLKRAIEVYCLLVMRENARTELLSVFAASLQEEPKMGTEVEQGVACKDLPSGGSIGTDAQ